MRRRIRKEVRKEVEWELYVQRRLRWNMVKAYAVMISAVAACAGTGVLLDLSFHCIFG
jgi:hypothetical protein